MLPQRSTTDAVTTWTILPLYRSLVDLCGRWELKKKKKKSKKVHDSAVRDHSFTQIFVHNDGIRKCSFMVPEYFFYFGFLKKLIDLSVQVFFCLFVYIC